MLMWVMSDRAIPRSFRFMEGFGVHTFRLVNDKGKSRFVKFHWKPLLGVHSVLWDEALKIVDLLRELQERYGLAYDPLREITVFCGAMAGACLGFLWYNAYPARVFMGDTGSLPLGGLIGYVAVVTRLELMLFIVGGVFVIEASSVLIQIFVFKATHGRKRVFRGPEPGPDARIEPGNSWSTASCTSAHVQ